MISNLKFFIFFGIFFFAFSVPKLGAETQLSSIVDSEYDSDSDKTISMDLQEAELKDVLKVFSIQSGLNFIASEAVKDRKITLYLDNVPIKEAMVRLFKANKLNYDYDEEANIFTVNYAEDALEPTTITRVYQLKYRSVSTANLEKEKANLFSGTSIASGRLSTTTTENNDSNNNITLSKGATNMLEAIKQMLSKSGKVAEDASTNSLIITDLADRFPAIEEVIFHLDQPQPQVMLEVEVLDVSKDNVDKLGFNLGDIDSSPNPLTILAKDGKMSFFSGDMSLKGTNTAGSLSIGAYYSAMLSFLTQQKDTRYLARPRVLTLNNETAEIGITKDEVMSMKMNRTTDSSGNTNVDISYDRATSLTLTPEGIGIFLRVTPHINMETGEITMVVNPKTSSASDSVTVNSGSTTSFYRDPEVRSTKSIIKIRDGDTIVLGGLIHQEKQEIRQKVPLLGDIPILGSLFRNRTTSKNLERELLVFITPHIMKEQGVKLAQGNKTAVSYLGQSSAQAPANSREAVVNMLNTFERERAANGQRKISQVGGAFN